MTKKRRKEKIKKKKKKKKKLIKINITKIGVHLKPKETTV